MREFKIATAEKNYSKNWITSYITWEEFVRRLEHPIRGYETYEAYLRMPKPKQDELKDHGGFVGGPLLGKRRTKKAVEYRDLVTLDMDSIPTGGDASVISRLEDLCCAAVVYSTRKHCPAKPRLRVIIPLDRPVNPDEYMATSRKLAADLGIEFCDPSTFDINRMMYWPTVSKDGEYVYRVFDGDALSVETTLRRYGPNDSWKNVHLWPRVPGNDERHAAQGGGQKLTDPREKEGLVGAFCRAYTIQEAIAKFIPEVYTPCDNDPNRWTYAHGSSYGGALVYDDLFIYSHHGTDPCGNKACNAWDMVRLHLYGDLDEEDSTTPVGKRKSDIRMRELAVSDTPTEDEYLKARYTKAEEDFAAEALPAEPVVGEIMGAAMVMDRLSKDKRSGDIDDVITNYVAVMRYDPHLAPIAFNELSNRLEVRSKVPWVRKRHEKAWGKADDAGIRIYMDEHFGLGSSRMVDDALQSVAMERHFDPIREYLDNLPAWDGVERVDTLLIDYFGAEDNVYTRAAMRKTLCAAIARIYHPGVKFDSVLVLRGPQGIGKSTFFARLAQEWFSDSLTLNDMKDKSGAEKLQGYWILELGELVGMRKTDAETVKSFISRQNDSYRAAYSPQVEDHPRRSIIVGTTNADSGFLRDTTGNRRFWPIECDYIAAKDVFELTDDDIKQIWAEAKLYYEEKEKLFMTGEAAMLALKAQEGAVEQDDRLGIVQAFLDRLLPESWEEMGTSERRAWLSNDYGKNVGTVKRMYVCRQEIYAECFGNDASRMDRADAMAITNILNQLPEWQYSTSTKLCGPYGNQRYYKRKDA